MVQKNSSLIDISPVIGYTAFAVERLGECSMNWFEVDKEGLRQIVALRGKGFIICELVQNALDEQVTRVDIEVHKKSGRSWATLTVEDDSPEGFQNLREAFTLFSPSKKKTDPTKRGRFDIGEKLVLAMCDTATILSTTGGVEFNSEGRRMLRSLRAKGTMFSATLKMNNVEYNQVCQAAQCLLIPPNVQVFFNGNEIKPRTPIQVAWAMLPSLKSDDEGVLKPIRRMTAVEIFELIPGETAHIYELGIPVVEWDCKWHVNVLQKVPLNMDRDNVTPAYLQHLRTLVLSGMYDLLTPEDANTKWVRAATDDDRCKDEATNRVLDLRFGEKRVGYDPSDPEANNIAVSQGYTVVPPRALSAVEWKNAKLSGAILPAGKVTPSPRPFSVDGDPLSIVSEKDWTPDMRTVVRYLTYIGTRLLKRAVGVQIANDSHWPFGATFGHGSLTLNLGRLGRSWFDFVGNREEINRLAIHEFSHERVSNHLSREMLDETCRLGAALSELVSVEPSIFDMARWRE